MAGRSAGRDGAVKTHLKARCQARLLHGIQHALDQVALDPAVKGLIVVLVGTPENIETDLIRSVDFGVLQGGIDDAVDDGSKKTDKFVSVRDSGFCSPSKICRPTSSPTRCRAWQTTFCPSAPNCFSQSLRIR